MNRPGELLVVEDVAETGASVLAEVVRAGGHVALAGGAAAEDAYRALDADEVDWSNTTVWFSDERVVAVDDDLSNAGAARAALLDRVDPRAVELVRTELGAAAAAADYEARIRREVPMGEAGLPSFDLVLLGLGPDGHTASLSPGSAAVEERERLVSHVDAPGREPVVPRVTFTLPLIDAAARVVFLVSGSELAVAAHRAFAEPPTRDVPASLADPGPGRLQVILDAAAAGRA
ncbi:MAG: 6-phosphogluconolactonase [Thermoleophilia bacterium]|nr:6-phosphogluconolactonase [Thermoleophilia bacterium]